MIQRAIAAVSLAALTAAPAAAQLDVARIDSLVEARRTIFGISGIALAIVHPLEVLHERGFGTVRDDTITVTPATPFAIPAYNGPITGTLTFRLVDRGALALDVPVTTYLPNFLLADSAAAQAITPRHLLLHRSGIPTGPLPVGSPPPAALDEAMTVLRGTRPASVPGESFTYAEANYHVLARLLEEVSGQPYRTLVQSEIRDPLGLAAPPATEPPGLLRFTASDLGRFVRTHLNLGALEDTTLLSMTSVVEMTSFDSGARYAAGWGWRTMPGRNAIGYSGVMKGSQAEIVMLTSDGIGVVLLANGTSTSQWRGMQQLAEDVARLTVGEEPLPGPKSPRGTLLLAFAVAVALGAAARVAQQRRQATDAIPTRS